MVNVGIIMSFLMPGGLLVAATIALVALNGIESWPAATVHAAAFFMLGCCVLVGVRFRRSRLLAGALLLAMARAAVDAAPGLHGVDAAPGAVRDVAALLIPLNVALLAWLREHSLLSRPALLQLALLLGQALGVLAAARYAPTAVVSLLNHGFQGWQLTRHLFLPAAGVAGHGLAALAVLLAYGYRRGRVEAGLFWVLPCTAAVLGLPRDSSAASVFLAAAALVLLVSVIESAFFLAYRDELTRLPARRALGEALGRTRNQFTIAMVDIDFFKKLNDRYGHDVGDQALRMVAARLARVGGGGKAYRYGGEEFVILFPGKSRTETEPHLEELRKAIATSSFHIRDRHRPRRKPQQSKTGKARTARNTKVTVSIGVAERAKRHREARDVLKAADKALYRAKNAGRNCLRK